MKTIHMHHTVWRLMILCVALGILTSSTVSHAAPLDYAPFITMQAEGFWSRPEGRMAFGATIGGAPGSVMDFEDDLGLPSEQLTWRLSLSVRPLEHHVVRVYGSIPERYLSKTTTKRIIITRNAVVPAGSEISSELKTGQFGLGYDLDFLIGPRWFSGMNMDLRYVSLQARINSPTSGPGDAIAATEMLPCLGGHFEGWLPSPLGDLIWPFLIGAYGRLTFGVNPDIVNYVNIALGLSCELRSPNGPALRGRMGYEYETIQSNLETNGGRILELHRDGVFFHIGTSF